MLSKDGLEAHEGGGDVEDRVCRFRQSPITHANHEDTLTNVRSTRSAINDGSLIMVDGREYQTRTSQGVKGHLRERPKLPTLTYTSLLAPSEGGL